MFIDSLKKGLAALPAAERARFEAEVRGFIGQEATHRHVHARFNAHLERQGSSTPGSGASNRAAPSWKRSTFATGWP